MNYGVVKLRKGQYKAAEVEFSVSASQLLDGRPFYRVSSSVVRGTLAEAFQSTRFTLVILRAVSHHYWPAGLDDLMIKEAVLDYITYAETENDA